MERSRDGYRGRYRDRHNQNSTNRNNYDERSTHTNYHGRSSHSNDHNGHYSSRDSPNGGFNYRLSRTSINSRPISSRNGPSTHYHHHRNDDYPPSSQHPLPSSSSNRTSSSNSSQSNYYDNSSSLSSRYDRSSNHREIYPSLLNEQSLVSNDRHSPNSLYYSSSSQSISLPRDRSLPLPPSQYIDSDRNRYIPSSTSNYQRDNSPLSMSSYRNERTIMDYGTRNITNDIYMRSEYGSPTPPSLVPLSVRDDSYGDIHRANDYNTRSERYDITLNRNNISSRDYPMSSVSSSSYRNSSTSSYIPHEEYTQDINYRPISQSRDYNIPSSRNSYSSSMDHQDNLCRNSRDYRSSYHDRSNLKRSSSRYNDNGPIPSKRPMRR